MGAEVGTAVTDGNAFNRGAADGTELAAQAVSHLELEVGGAQCTIGAEIVFYAGSLVADSSTEHSLYRPVQAFHFSQRQASSRPQGVDSGEKQGFISIHITNTGHEGLVE